MRKFTNPHVIARLEGIQKILMAHHAAGAKVPAATKGSERETVIREFLGKVFPMSYRFGTGAVTDSTGNQSGQLDIVVEWPFFPGFPTPGATERLYLAESVAFVVEVKSNLTSQWNEVESTVSKLRPLRRNWCGHLKLDAGGSLELGSASTSRMPYFAIGFEGPGDLDNLRDRLAKTPEDKRPDGALVIDSGAFSGIKSFGVGAAGLLAFCVDATYCAVNISTALPDLNSYLS